MHKVELRQVAERYTNIFSTPCMRITVCSVHFDDDQPAGFEESFYDQVPSFRGTIEHMGSKLPTQMSQLFADSMQKELTHIAEMVERRIEACKKPTLIFPDDFKDGINAIEEMSMRLVLAANDVHPHTNECT